MKYVVLIIIMLGNYTFGYSEYIFQKNINEEIDYDEPPCGANRICEKEKLAISRYNTGFNDELILYFDELKRHLKVNTQEMKSLVNLINYSADKTHIENLVKVKNSMLDKIDSAIKTIRIYEIYRIKYPDAKCIFPNNYHIIYYFCSYEKLSKKLISLGVKNTELYIDYYNIGILLSSEILKIKKHLEFAKKDLETDSLVVNTYSQVPYLSVIGTPKEWIGFISNTFSNFSNEVKLFSSEVIKLKNLETQILNDKERENRLSIETKSLQILKKQEEVRGSLNFSKRKKLQINILKMQSQKKSLKINFGLNIENHISNKLYKITPPKTIYYDQDRGERLLQNPISFLTPKNAVKMAITPSNRVLIRSHGLITLPGKDENLPAEIWGKFTDLDGYYSRVLRKWWYKGDDKDPTNITYRIWGENNQIRHDSAADPWNAVGSLQIRTKNGSYKGVGTGTLMSTRENQSYSIVLNDYLKADLGWKPLLNKNFALNIQFFGSTVQAFKKTLSDLDEKITFGPHIAYSANPYEDGLSLARHQLINKYGNPKEIVDLFSSYIKLKISELVLEKKISRTIEEKVELRNLALIIEKNIQGIDQKIKILKQIKSTKGNRKVIQKYVKKYIELKFKLGKENIHYYINDLTKWLNVYIKSVQYHFPQNKRLENKVENVIKITTNFLNNLSDLKPHTLNYFSETDYIDTLCSSLTSINGDYGQLCKEFDETMDQEILKNKLAKFFYKNDQDLKIDNMVFQKDLMHCSLDFDNPIGKKYLKNFLKVKNVKDLFNREGKVNYFAKKNGPIFNGMLACHLSNKNTKRCMKQIEKKDPTSDPFKELEGYFSVPISTIYDSDNDNLICDSTSRGGPPNFLGIAVEWTYDSEIPTDKVPPILKGYVEKSPITYWLYEDNKGNLVQNIASIYHMIEDGYIIGINDRDIRSFPIVEKNYIKNYCPTKRYTDRSCIEKLFGQISSGNKYQFKTTFLNSRIGNDWHLHLPIYSKINDTDNLNHIFASALKKLKFHFYFEAKSRKSKKPIKRVLN